MLQSAKVIASGIAVSAISVIDNSTRVFKCSYSTNGVNNTPTSGSNGLTPTSGSTNGLNSKKRLSTFLLYLQGLMVAVFLKGDFPFIIKLNYQITFWLGSIPYIKDLSDLTIFGLFICCFFGLLQLLYFVKENYFKSTMFSNIVQSVVLSFLTVPFFGPLKAMIIKSDVMALFSGVTHLFDNIVYQGNYFTIFKKVTTSEVEVAIASSFSQYELLINKLGVDVKHPNLLSFNNFAKELTVLLKDNNISDANVVLQGFYLSLIDLIKTPVIAQTPVVTGGSTSFMTKTLSWVSDWCNYGYGVMVEYPAPTVAAIIFLITSGSLMYYKSTANVSHDELVPVVSSLEKLELSHHLIKAKLNTITKVADVRHALVQQNMSSVGNAMLVQQEQSALLGRQLNAVINAVATDRVELPDTISEMSNVISRAVSREVVEGTLRLYDEYLTNQYAPYVNALRTALEELLRLRERNLRGNRPGANVAPAAAAAPAAPAAPIIEE